MTTLYPFKSWNSPSATDATVLAPFAAWYDSSDVTSYNKLFGLNDHTANSNIKIWTPGQDNAASTVVVDETGNTNGTLEGGDNTADIQATSPLDWTTNALNLDGSHAINFGDPSSVDFGANEYLIAVTFRATSVTGRQMVVGKDSPSQRQFAIEVDADNGTSTHQTLQISHWQGGGPRRFRTGKVLSDNTWYRAIFWKDGSSYRLLLNGTEVSLTEVDGPAGTLDSRSSNLYIGRRNYSGYDDYLTGDISEVVFAETDADLAVVQQIDAGPEPVYTSGASLDSDGNYDVGTWGLDSPFSSGSNGTITYDIYAVLEDGTLIDSSLDGSATGTLDLSSTSEPCYLLVRASNDGGSDIGDYDTRTSSYGWENDGIYEVATTAKLSYLGVHTNDGNGTSYTFSSVSFGDAASDRYIAALVLTRNNIVDITSVTIGGVTATEIVTATDTNGRIHSALYLAAVPTGTTGDVVVNWSGSAINTSLDLYRLVGIDATAHDTATDINTSSDSSLTIDVPANGVVIGGGVNAFTADSDATLTGLTQDSQRIVDFGRLVSGSDEFASSETGRAIEIDWDNQAFAGQVLAAASFAPASDVDSSGRTINNITSLGLGGFTRKRRSIIVKTADGQVFRVFWARNSTIVQRIL